MTSFQVTNISLVSWFFLIFFPRWKQLKSAVIVGPVVNASFYAAVAFLAARNPDAPAVNFKSLEGGLWKIDGEDSVPKSQICLSICRRIRTKIGYFFSNFR